MRIPLAIAVALFAAPAYAKPLECVLWPHSQACRPQPPPPPQIIYVPVPAPPVATPLPTARPATAPKPRIKSNFAKPLKAAKRKAAVQRALPAWCARVPNWASQAQVESTAETMLGRPMSPTERQQARDCLASKRTS